MAMRTDPHELLSTGEVARILGSSVQHVVDLCQRGEMAYTLVGTHRRIRRSDAEALSRRSANNAGGPMTRDQLRALWLHRAVAAKVAADPAGVLAQAKSTASSLLAREPDGAPWLRQWLALLDRGPEAVMRTLTSTDPLARELRANSPFAGVLSTSEREAILTSFLRAASSTAER
jgi:excisionase family DNA binding protein